MKLTSSVNDRAVIQKLSRLPDKMRGVLTKKVNALTLKLQARVQAKLSDDVLHVRTGNLRRSIHSVVESGGTSITGQVSSSGDVKYAGIQEYGGKTPAHDILPDKAKALAFMVGGKQVFAAVVHHPGSNIPERSYLRSSLAEMKEEIREGISEAVKEGLK